MDVERRNQGWRRRRGVRLGDGAAYREMRLFPSPPSLRSPTPARAARSPGEKKGKKKKNSVFPPLLLRPPGRSGINIMMRLTVICAPPRAVTSHAPESNAFDTSSPLSDGVVQCYRGPTDVFALVFRNFGFFFFRRISAHLTNRTTDWIQMTLFRKIHYLIYLLRWRIIRLYEWKTTGYLLRAPKPRFFFRFTVGKKNSNLSERDFYRTKMRFKIKQNDFL